MYPVVLHCAAVFLINLRAKLMSCDGLAKIQGLLPVKHHVGSTDIGQHRHSSTVVSCTTYKCHYGFLTSTGI